MDSADSSGSSWFVFDAGMPPAMVLDLAVSNANRSLRAATFGNGVYERELRPLNVFDYRTLAFVSPPNGSEVPANVAIAPVAVSLRNVGAVLSADSFNVRYSFLSGLTEVYSNTKRVPPLTPGEIRTVTFDGSYTPTGTGSLTLKAITIAGDQNALNDTLTGSVTVVSPGTIAAFNAVKTSCVYTEISGGTPGPSGDDELSSIALPFPFTFDGYTYDSLQISTNGWVEFGNGARGSLRGLSDVAVIGLGNENGRLYSTARPTKTLGAWFEDMNTTGGGDISHKLLISQAGDSVFVIQWKNMLAYFDPGTTTTRINFQIRLYANLNIVEYDYGPVIPGTLSGGDLGAMIGTKDHLGGNFHFYDIALGGTGTTGQAITNLSPLTDWPGEDSCYFIGPDIVTPIAPLIQNWNLVSVPVIRPDNRVLSVFPSAVGGTTFSFSASGYVPDTVLAAGRGYWTKFPAAVDQLIWGNSLQSVSAGVNAGWNLVGSVDHIVPAPSGGIIVSVFYQYGTSGYTPASTLKPGFGYWVKTSTGGTITIGPTAPPAQPAFDLAGLHVLKIKDGRGQGQTLYFGEQNDKAPDPERFEMPPMPPYGSFTARFAGNRMLVLYPAELDQNRAFTIELESTQLPVVVSAEIGEAGRQFFLDVTGTGKTTATHELLAGTTTDVRVAEQSSIVLRVTGGSSLPREFALGQNYPNPFNPSATIEYALPVASHVALKVYDILGREVTTLVNEVQNAGYQKVKFDAGDLASGVYLYRLEAGNFTSVKKLLLLK